MNQSLRAALAQGKTEAVIAELLERSTHDDDLHNQVVALSARYAQYEKQYLGNLEEASVLNIELNKINAAVLDIIDQLDPAPAVVPRSRPWVKVLTIATVFAVLGAVFMFSGFSLRDLFGKKALPVSTQTSAPAPQRDTNTAPAPVSPANSTFERKPVPGSSEQGQNSMIVTCKTNKGRGNLYFKSGEYMRFYAKVGQPCFLRCIYRMADGRLMLLDADRQLNTEAVDQWLVVGPLFQAAEPYGEEEMYVFAQEGAFEPLKTRNDPDGYIFIEETLEDALLKSRSMRKKYRLNESGLRLKTVL